MSHAATPATRARHIAPLLVVLLAGLLARVATAQTWNETGDAGNLPASAQVTAGSGPLQALNGFLDSPTDVDMYCINVPQAGAFLARLQCVVTLGPHIWLFNAAGQGIAAASLCQAGSETITSLLVPGPGTYYVAVAYDGVLPVSGAGPIWTPLIGTERAPDGPGAGGPLTSWAGVGNVQPLNPYQILFLGTAFCSAATPAGHETWGALKLIYRD